MLQKFSRTWWGKQFIESLEKFTEPHRLGRGRSYARNGKIVSYEIVKGEVKAKVRGSVNPYFGVYKEPLYKTTIKIKAFSKDNWTKLIKLLSSKASLISKLLMNEMPDNIESALKPFDLHLLPSSKRDFETKCSCPDYENPCKHIAGVYYLLAAELDSNPFLMFELRGMSNEELQKELKKSTLGQILSDVFTKKTINLKSSDFLFTKLEKSKIENFISLNDFWTGKKRIPHIEPLSPNYVSAPLIKKQGDFPPFWKNEESFIKVMEDLYQKVKKTNL